MSLKTGDWKMNANGIERLLTISGVDPKGAVSGTLGLPIFGLWDETSRTLTFGYPAGVSYPPQHFYKGFLFSTPPTPTPGVDVLWTLAGYFQVCDLQTAEAHGGNVRRNIFGWFAQITEVA